MSTTAAGTTFRGNLKDIPFPKLLSEIYGMGVSGTLTLSRGKAKKDISISSGMPTKVHSNLLQEVLGRYLVKAGKITEDQYHHTLKIAFESKKQHGGVMVENGLLSEKELDIFLKNQSLLKLLNLFKWIDGDYFFIKRDLAPKKSSLDGVSMPTIIIKGIKWGYSLDRVRKAMGPYSNYYLYPGESKLFSLDVMGLNSQEEWLVNFVDGTRTVKETIEMSPLEFIDSCRLLYASIIMNILDVKEAAATAPVTPKESSKQDEVTTNLLKKYQILAGQNYFEVLGVEQDAQLPEIKKAYLSLAKQYHPDSFPKEILPKVEKTVNRIFDTINKAYRVISNDREKHIYIRSMTAPDEKVTASIIQDITNAELQFQKGKLFLKKKSYEDAKNSFKWSVKLAPDEGEYLAYLGWAFFLIAENKKGGDAVKAITYLKKASVLNPSIEIPFIFLGIIYKVQDLKDVAILQFKKALEINPSSVDAKRELTAISGAKSDQKRFFGKKNR